MTSIIKTLDELLDFLEVNINEDHINFTKKLHQDTIAYNTVPYLPLTLAYKPENVNLFPYSEAFFDPEKMLFNELIKTVGGAGTYQSVLICDHFPLQVRSNYGIGILPSLFGAISKIVDDNLPWVEHIEPAKLKKIIGNGVPELNQALGKRVYETNRYFMDRLSKYPKCSRSIRVTQPDMQGPFDVAHLLMGNDIFLNVYDEPDFLHELLEVITQTYIMFNKSLQDCITDKADGGCYLHGFICGGNVLIKDDTAIINLSEKMYREFSKPYNETILQKLGGGSIHYCGPVREWHLSVLDSPFLKGINYGNPEMHDLSQLTRSWSTRKIPNLQWGDSLGLEWAKNDFLSQIETLDIKTGLTLTVRANNLDEARETIRLHTQQFSF